MRIAILDETNTVINVIVAAEAALPALGITRYKVVAEGEAVEIGQVLENPQPPV